MRSLLQVYVGSHEEDDSAVFVLDRVVVAKLGSVEVDGLAVGDWESHDSGRFLLSGFFGAAYQLPSGNVERLAEAL